MSATYAVTGHHPAIGEIDATITYRSDGSVIIGALGSTDAIWLNLDLETGLVSHVKTRYRLQGTPDALDIGQSTWEITPSYGAPVLGSYYNSGLNLPLNPIPPPSWLDTMNSERTLGREYTVDRYGQQVTLGPDPYGRALGVEENETWIVDHPVFPIKHSLRVRLGNNSLDLDFSRVTAVEPWPINAVTPNVTTPSVGRASWKTYPPLGTGKLGIELQDFLTQVGREHPDVDFESDRTLVWDIAIWGDQSLPASNLGIVNRFTASINIYVDGRDNIFNGRRTGIDAGPGLPWTITRSTIDFQVQVATGPWPDLIPLSDAYAAHQADWINNTAPWRVSLYDQILKENPALGAQLWTGKCEGGQAELRFYSLWNGAEILRQLGQC